MVACHSLNPEKWKIKRVGGGGAGAGQGREQYKDL